MHRLFILLALTGLLVACTGQSGETADQSPTSPVSTPVSSPADGAAGTASPECTESFAAVEAAGVTSVTELGDLQEEVQATIEGCESLDDWIAGAQDVIGEEINPNTAALLLRMGCGDPSVSSTPICQELASS